MLIISTEKKKNTCKTKIIKKNKMLIINIMRKYIINLLIIKFKAFYFFYVKLVSKVEKFLISGESTCALQGY